MGREEGRIVTKAAYVALGINGEGYKDILGIWVGENEGVKFWLKVCNELKNQGVEDILIVCIDGLKDLTASCEKSQRTRPYFLLGRIG